MNKKNIYIINGPNLSMIGLGRSTKQYGNKTLKEINKEIESYAKQFGYNCIFKNSNHEGYIIDYLYEAMKNSCGVVINPGALAHYSYALRDAIECITTQIPCVEVHLTDITKRESFRHKSVTSEVANKTIKGKLEKGYLEAIDFIHNYKK